MSNQLKNNLNAIELTENDLDSVVGGNSLAALNNAMNAQASASAKMAQMQMLAALQNATKNTIKKTGQSVKSASQ